MKGAAVPPFSAVAAALFLLLLATVQCTSGTPAQRGKDAQHGKHAAAEAYACDPLVSTACGLPWPNDFWRHNGTLTLLPETLPVTNDGSQIDPKAAGFDGLDGFSPVPNIQTYLKDASLTNCASFLDMAASLKPDSPTVLLNAATGERVPHWVELDHFSDNIEPLGYSRTLMIWPAHRLNDSTRYIVAIHSLLTDTGKFVEPDSAFVALRNNISSEDPAVEYKRPHYERDIFPVLTKAGVERSTLQMTWDFTVQSTECQTGRLVSMRDDAFQRVAGGIEYRVTKVTENPSSSIARRIDAVFSAPWYLNQYLPGPKTRLVLDPNNVNRPVFTSMREVSFTLNIPKSLVENGTAGGIMQYGHGLFGSHAEVNTGYLDDEANKYGYIIVGSDWIGLTNLDAPVVLDIMAGDLTDLAMIPDRLHQGMLNALLLMKLVSSDSFAQDPNVVFNGKTTIDTSKRWYYGNSNGGILGGVYMAATTQVERGVLGVPGGPYTLLLPRSKDFTAIGDLLKARFRSPQARIYLLAIIQVLWNRLDPAGYMHHVSRSPLPGTPKHRVIFHYGLGDAQVSWLGAHMMARSIGSSMYKSNVQERNETLFGFDLISDDVVLKEGNLILGFDFGTPDAPLTNTPPQASTDTHEKPRRQPTAQEQTNRFLTTGEIANPCGGPCRADPRRKE